MYWLCMIATIPLATGNKLNCFISARGMLAIVWHCVLLFCCFLLCVFFVDFLHVNKSSSQKKKNIVQITVLINCVLLAYISLVGLIMLRYNSIILTLEINILHSQWEIADGRW